jgi:hypothetical protein
MQSLTSIAVLFCDVTLNGVHSSQLNFKAYVCQKVVHRLLVIFIGQIIVLTSTMCILWNDLPLISYIYTRQRRILNIWEPYRPARHATGIDRYFNFYVLSK